MKSFALATLVSGSVLAFGLVLGTVAAQAQQACTAYQHANFQGKSFGLGTNKSVANSKLTNNISSFKMVSGCSVIAYSEPNFKGPNVRWSKNVAFVGPQWNDVISSYRCVCN
jgi:hypothetical protein